MPVITKRTVLILGAGASMPFGFPSGKGLVTSILALLEKDEDSIDAVLDREIGTATTSRNILARALRNPASEGHVDQFCEMLFKSGLWSIDAFLEHHPQFLKVGKMAIASVLAPLENENQLQGFDNSDWYGLLFNYLHTKFEEFGENLSILTYNYDRSLEQFLLTSLRYSSEGMEYEYARCWDQLSKIPIIHLHGLLGDFPRSLDPLTDQERTYTPALSCRDLDICYEAIRVGPEDIANEPQFQQAHGLIRDAEVVCFLGFGWDPTNLSRLILNTSENFKATRKFYGTSYNRHTGENRWVKEYFSNLGGIELGVFNSKIDSFLREERVLF